MQIEAFYFLIEVSFYIKFAEFQSSRFKDLIFAKILKNMGLVEHYAPHLLKDNLSQGVTKYKIPCFSSDKANIKFVSCTDTDCFQKIIESCFRKPQNG